MGQSGPDQGTIGMAEAVARLQAGVPGSLVAGRRVLSVNGG